MRATPPLTTPPCRTTRSEGKALSFLLSHLFPTFINPYLLLPRLAYHATYDGFRGDTFKASGLGTYDVSWEEKTKAEKPFKPFPLLVVFNADNHTFFDSPADMKAYEAHLRLEQGEVVRINRSTSMTRTSHSKYSKQPPFSPALHSTLKASLPPEATPSDLQTAQILLHSNLAQSTRKAMSTAERTLKSLIPSRDVFTNPHPEDKGLLLLKLKSAKPNLSPSTMLQYVKYYACILRDNGIEPPPDTFLYIRLASGLRKLTLDPAQNVKAAKKRAAYSTHTLRLAASAVAKKCKTRGGPWDELLVQALYTAMLIAFWACARTSELCGASKASYSPKTTLLERDVKLLKVDNETVLELFFKSEKVIKESGSRVQLPMIPHGSNLDLCPVRAYQRYQTLKRRLRPAPDAPWLIDGKGRPLTQKAFTALVHKAIENEYANSKHSKLMAALKGHSFRAGLPTTMEEISATMTTEEMKMMGRWASEAAYQRYCKGRLNKRLPVAKKVLAQLEAQQSPPLPPVPSS